MKNNSIVRSAQIFLLLGLAALASIATAQDLDPTRFENTILGFEASDMPSRRQLEGAILLTGSSSIARWNDQAEAALAPLSVIPRGFGGSVMGDVLALPGPRRI